MLQVKIGSLLAVVVVLGLSFLGDGTVAAAAVVAAVTIVGATVLVMVEALEAV